MTEKDNGHDILGDVIDDKAVKVLQGLQGEPLTVRKLARKMDMAIATTYRRINLLEEVGLVDNKGTTLLSGSKRAKIYGTDIERIKVDLRRGEVEVEQGTRGEVHADTVADVETA